MADLERASAGNEKARSGPLSGLKVLEFVGIGPGPFAAMLLADMGADILRIDRPGGGDPYSRNVVNRGRPTLFVDLKDASQVTDLMSLIERSDALIEGFRPGVMERLGLGPDLVLQRNPKLVYGRMTGWGQTGPLSQIAGHDINYISVAGALAAIGPEDRPVPPLNLAGDYGGGSLYLVAGILAGIISAQQTGLGQVVDCAICDGAASLMAMFADLSSQGQWTSRRAENLLDGGAPFYRTFECSDGKHLSVGALEPKFYDLLCTQLGFARDELPDRDDVRNWKRLHTLLEQRFKLKTRDEWCQLLSVLDTCVTPVLTLSEAAAHPHMADRQTFIDINGVAQPAPAPRFSGTPSSVRKIADKVVTMDAALARWI
ncbi:CaiB/BaiF CoA transferase family protein [Microvirga puerhi]|uniref:CoA transferase n=1 Tax=Microvirga puerhi TaxID=2876078 RepID=A0ABS7VSG6_9HYPH|nr:CaiB/BaiF CoA-transferase family protein [Microvirga puerhi]MBZ6078485.1 CoA transferase [Microvirga puerhi]